MTDEDRDNLHWHALNYRTAATQDAHAMWLELEACVERKVAAERARWRAICKDFAEDPGRPDNSFEDTYDDGWLDACNEIMWKGEKTDEPS